VPLIRELIENCDLVAAELETLKLEDLETDIMGSIPVDLLPRLLDTLASDIVRSKRSNPVQAARILRLTRVAASRVAGPQARGLEQLFRKLHREGVLGLEELPVELQDQFHYEGKAELLLSICPYYALYLDYVNDATEYDGHLAMLRHALPELIRRAEYDHVLSIVEQLKSHCSAAPRFKGRDGWAQLWFAKLEGSPLGAGILTSLEGADALARAQVLAVCRVAGRDAFGLVLRALASSGHRRARQELCDFLESNAELMLGAAPRELERPNAPWYYLRNLVEVLGRIGGTAVLDLVKPFASHPEPRLRRAALEALASGASNEAEPLLVAALRDFDPAVRASALDLLARHRSVHKAFFAACCEVLTGLNASNEEEACRVCGLLKDYVDGPGHAQAVELLLNVLGKEAQLKGVWSSLGKTLSGETPHEQVMVAACHALGRLRAHEASLTLRVLTKSRSDKLRQAASLALRRIETGASPAAAP